ncbi:hypothetical protein Tsubulata_026487 [Turnera subulata]|uniref:Protein kinase domain-containing protein n=1 Tax=Turnera subulata TaxID=218843 RepID=A0A9Q0F234_9ROSI|nr:hypothetical protein Tsubulata_026487 [Turnera subulata]
MQMMEKEHETTCFECLERRINTDFSHKLVFCYGLSDSPFPVASSAVVQVSIPAGEASSTSSSEPASPSSSSSQFILVQLPTHHHHHHQHHNCFTNYIPPDAETSTSYSPTGQSSSSSGLSNGNRNASTSPAGFGTCSCSPSTRFSCVRTITALAPLAHLDHCSSSAFQTLASSFWSGCLEDHVLGSLNQLIEGRASGQDAVNFLRLLGMPSFDDWSVPGCLRHPNLAPILGLLKTSEYVNLVIAKAPYTLENILHYCPGALKSEWHIRFLMYQLLSSLAYLHGLGVPHGNLRPSNIMLNTSCWTWVCIWDKPVSEFNFSRGENGCSAPAAYARTSCPADGCSSQALFADLKLSPYIDWNTQFEQWWRGELSNFEYLLILNRLAGRRWGDHTFHTVMPWVIDFTAKPDENSDLGWRDLSKSKWRLAKGDEQLDFTYSTSEIPHHVSDECLSELAVCSYKARRLPLSVLRLAVRSVYEPNEYPSNMQRLYQWTPDECIPEFYCDPKIFYSQHSGMTDLAVPLWADSPEEFIKQHRDALESKRVSSQIHHWIDITFGYKMSGQAAIAAKNVMLPSSESTMLRSVGRRQLFTRPHPVRQCATRKKHDNSSKSSINRCQLQSSETPFLSETSCLQELEEASAFSEHAGDLNPQYFYHPEKFVKNSSSVAGSASEIFGKHIIRPLEISENCGLSSNISLSFLLDHMEEDVEGSMGYQQLLHWRQNASCFGTISEDFAKDIFSLGCVLAELYLKRPLFNSTSLAAYIEVGVLPRSMQELPPHVNVLVEACIQKDWTRRPSSKSILESPYFPATVKSSYLFIAPLQLLANDGSRLRYAANFAKQGVLRAMGTFAAEMCAPYCLPLVASSGSETEAESAYVLLKEFMKCLTPKATTGDSHLKVSLLQGSFVQEIWNLVGKQTYLETIHPLVISNLYVAPHKSSAAVASVLLIGTSEELGGLYGETFIVRQLLPLLKQVICSCVDVSSINKPEPVQSWNALALIDCLTTLDGLVPLLPRDVVIKEIIEDKSCLLVMVLMQKHLEISVLQVAASTLMGVCELIGPDLTASHVLPQLKEFFDELAFSQETVNDSGSFGRGESRNVAENIISKRTGFTKTSPSDYSPAKLLLNGVGWSIPQSQGIRGGKNLMPRKRNDASHQSQVGSDTTLSNFLKREPWFWFPSPAASWDGPDFLGRVGSLKDELPWKIRASVIYSIRAHHGALRSLAVSQDECMIFTAGAGSGFKGTVQKWELSRINCTSGYQGHEEVVNDICVLSSSGRIASCDGTIHVWNSGSGKMISVFSETSADFAHFGSAAVSAPKSNGDHPNMLNSNTLSSGGLLSSAFDGSLYTCMHYLESFGRLVVGTGNGSLRFIDLSQCQKLHIWKGESFESTFPSLVSAVCSCGSDKDGALGSPSWVATGLSSGHCKLFDLRSGNVIASWRAHDGYVTKLAAPEDHLLVSSSLDRSLRIWDLRRNWPPPQPTVFKGHTDGVAGFSVWGQDIISISKNKIGLSTLSRSSEEDGQQRIVPQKLYVADHGAKNLSVLSKSSSSGAEDFLPVDCFVEIVDDATLYFQIIRLPKQVYVWIGCNSTKLGHLYAAAPTRPNNTVSVSCILGGSSDNTGSGIARRLVLKTGLNIILSCNIPKNRAILEASAEKILMKKLIHLGYARPKSLVKRIAFGTFYLFGIKETFHHPTSTLFVAMSDIVNSAALPGVSIATSEALPTHYTVKIQQFSLLAKNAVERYENGSLSKWKQQQKYERAHLSLPSNHRHKFTSTRLGDATGKERRFHRLRLEWGFDQLIQLAKFNDANSGYLVEDTCVFGVEVYVTKERSTGNGECLKMIQLYPKGNGFGTGTYLSLYLALADSTALAPASKVYVDFTLRVLDQVKDRKLDLFGKGKFWFSATSLQSGWSRYISLDYLYQPSNALVYKDICIVEAELTVLGIAGPL